MSATRVLLADDHALVRAGLHSLLQTLPDVEVVAEAGDGREAMRLIETTHPDVVLMDITMPGLNGLEAAARITKDHPTVRLIMLSGHAGEDYVAQALRAGAAGYLLKDSAVAELELALKAVLRGQTYLSSAVSKQVVEGYLGHAEGKASPLEGLTARQREILQLIAEGNTTKDIAHLLNVSVKTVETHRMQLMERLDIHDVAGLVRLAIRAGIVSSEK